MTTQFPSALDQFVNPLPTDPPNNPSHAGQHADINDAMEAVQAYLGVSTSLDPDTITGRLAALESGSYVDLTSDQDVGGIKSWLEPARFKDAVFFDSVNGIEFGLIDMLDDPNSSTGKVMVVESDAGVRVGGPYVTLDTTSLRITVPGALPGSLVSVAGVDAFGNATLGYTQPLPSSFSVTDTNTSDVVIKATNVAPDPVTWIDLGLSVTLPDDIAAGSGNVAYEMVLVNNTTRTGVLEFGLQVNGTVLSREILTQIPANFNQTVSANIPLTNAYSQGDVLALVARVTSNNNNQFSLLMDATPDAAGFTVWAVGASTGDGGSTAWGTIVGTLSSQADLQAALDGKLGVGDTAASSVIADTVNDNGPGTSLKFAAVTQAEFDAIVTKDPTTQYNIRDAPGIVASIADAVVDNGAGTELKFWFGTEAQYTAIATKDPQMVYLRSA